MRKFPILFAILLLPFSCEKGKADNGGGTEKESTSFVLRSAFERITRDAKVLEISEEKDIYTVCFSDESKIRFDNINHGYITVGAEDYIYVNGHSRTHKFVENPYWTIGADGMWYQNGEKTNKRATPVNPDAPEGSVYLVNVLDGPRKVEFRFSDGETLVYPRAHTHHMYVQKTATEMGVYIGIDEDHRYIYYPFYKRYKTYSAGAYPSYYDNWGIGALKLCTRTEDGSFNSGTDLFLRGEAEMAVNIPRADDATTYTYVGGTLHGFENILTEDGTRCLEIKIDGVPIQETATVNMTEASKIEMYQKSLLCQAYSNTNPWAEAQRWWTFENGDLQVKISLKILRDISIKQAQFGMMCVLRHWQGNESANYLTRYAIKDSAPNTVFELTDGWQSSSPLTKRDHKAHRITEYGERALSFALVTDTGTRKANGGMFVGTNGNAYNKIYFDLTGAYEATAGETLESEIHWEIDRIR